MEKLKTLFKTDAVRLSVTALIVFFAVYCAFPAQGLLSSLPLLLLSGIVIPFFYDEAAILVPVAALSSVALAFLMTDTFDEKIFYAFVPTLFFVAAFFVSRLIRLFLSGTKTPLLPFIGLLGAVLLIILWHAVFGNPATLVSRTGRATDFYTATYPEETFTLTERYYSPLERAYVTEFETRDAHFRATEEEDGYLALLKAHAAELQKSRLLKLLHENFSDGNYLITIELGDGETTEAPLNYGDTPLAWLSSNRITLEFDASVAVGSPDARAEFAHRIRAYVTLLRKEDFPCASITFCGGEYDEMVYELTVLPTTPIEELVAPNVVDLTK